MSKRKRQRPARQSAAVGAKVSSPAVTTSRQAPSDHVTVPAQPRHVAAATLGAHGWHAIAGPSWWGSTASLLLAATVLVLLISTDGLVNLWWAEQTWQQWRPARWLIRPWRLVGESTGMVAGAALVAAAIIWRLRKANAALPWRVATQAVLARLALYGAALLASGAAVQVGKAAFARLRPRFSDSPDGWLSFRLIGQLAGERFAQAPTYALFERDWNAFPSGHTTMAFTVAVACGVLCRASTPAWAVLLAAAALCGVSRVFDRAHYPGDVWAGALLGACAAYLTLRWLMPLIDKRLSPRARAAMG